MNPVLAGLVESIQDLVRYRWTGHAGVFGRYDQTWHDTDEMLTFLGESRRTARKRIRDIVARGAQFGLATNLSGDVFVRSYGGWEALYKLRKEHSCRIGDERRLGASNCVEQALRKDELNINLKSRLELVGWDLEKPINCVCSYCSVNVESLLKKVRNRNIPLAKSLICCL